MSELSDHPCFEWAENPEPEPDEPPTEQTEGQLDLLEGIA